MRLMMLCALGLLAVLHLAGCARSEAPEFDADSAFVFLQEQCDLGPRYPGSPGHVELRRYLIEKLEAFGAAVSRQPFDAVPTPGDTLHLMNIIAKYRPDARSRILLGAHYDTRPRADRDPNPENRAKPIIGANDGASGVAVLLEIARLLGAWKPPVGVDLVFFDGEDYGEEGHIEDYLLGSRRFASGLGVYRPTAVIVVDMVGERDSSIPIEGFSSAASPGLCARIYGIAETLGVKNFVRSQGPTIYDDHFPFIQAGIAAVVLIDFDYPYWHTLADTPDKCDGSSLAAVGSVLVRFIEDER
jgi:Zn-dependent M28 family amino/carboxypeptidase